jgi:hypothetical protein
MEGLLLFAKYGLPPNARGFCGSKDCREIVDCAKADPAKYMSGLRAALLKFENALPYLRFIALENGIKDEFDVRVVEAYWLGNNLLSNISMGGFAGHLEDRFKGRMKNNEWKWLLTGSLPEAKPFHGFHVLDIYRRVDFKETDVSSRLLDQINFCRICWGEVKSFSGVEAGGRFAEVSYLPLEFSGKKIILSGRAKTRKVFINDLSIAPGDTVSIHWDYVCDKLDLRQENNLIYWTKFHLNLANKTI